VVRSSSLAADAQSLSADDPGVATELAIAAYRASPTQDAATQLYAALDTPLLDRILGTTRSPVERVATQADGPLGAAVEQNGTVLVWNLSDPARPVLNTTLHAAASASAIALSPRSPQLAGACPGASVLCLWNLANTARPTLEARLPNPAGGRLRASSMAFSPNGSLLAVASANGYTLLWSIAQPAHPRLLADLPNPTQDRGGALAAAAFTPDSRVLAETIEDGATSLWSLNNPADPTRLATLDTGYQDIAFDPQGGMLAAVSDTSLGLWNIADPKSPTWVTVNNASLADEDNEDLEALAFSPDGSTMAFGGLDVVNGNSQLCMLDLSPVNLKGEAEPNCLNTGFGTFAMAYTSEGALLTGDWDETVRLWRSPLTQIDNIATPDTDASLVDNADSDGRLLAALAGSPGSQNPAAFGIWDIAAPGRPVLEATVHLPGVVAVSFLTASVVQTITQGGAVQLWNVADPRHPVIGASLGTAVIPSTPGWQFSGEVTRDAVADLVAVLGTGGHLHLWRVTGAGEAAEIGSISDPAASQGPAGILPDGHTALMETSAGIEWWDIRDPARPVRDVFSPLANANTGSGAGSGGLFAAGPPAAPVDGGVILRLFDLVNGQVRTTVTLSTHVGGVAAISVNGSLLASTGAAGNGVTLWDIRDPQHPRSLATVPTLYDITGAAFNQAASLITVWNTSTIQLWDVRDPTDPVLEASISPTIQVNGMALSPAVANADISPSGTLFASFDASYTSYVDVFDTDPAELASRLCKYVGSSITAAQWQQDAPGIPYQNPCP